MKVEHIVLICFTGVGLAGGYRGDAWYAARIDIFKNYTLKSLQNQTEKDFTVWMTFRTQELWNPLTTELRKALERAKIKHIFTFDGLPYHDDKFGGSYWNRLKNSARIIRSCYRNKTLKDLIPNIKETFQDKNTTLVQRLRTSLGVLKKSLNSDAERILLTRIDSDDMFRKDAFTLIRRVPAVSTLEGTRFTRGYIYNTTTNQLAEFNPQTNPPFHTIFFSSGVFFNAGAHFSHYRGYTSHEDIPTLFVTYPLSERAFCVTTRDNPKLHLSTNFAHSYRGNMIKDAILKKQILSTFGITVPVE